MKRFYPLVLLLLAGMLFVSASVHPNASAQQKVIIQPEPLIQLALPDLVVDDVWLNKGCQVVVRVKNNGPGKVPNDVWDVHTPKSAGIYLWKDGKSWGGATIWKFDPAKSLQSPGGTAVYTSNLTVSGSATIAAQVDRWNTVKERSETNNKRKEKLICQPSAGVITPLPAPVPLKLLPDLIVDGIWLNKSCQVVVRVKNNGPGQVPDDVWSVHSPKSAGVYLWKDGKQWGGATIWKFDPAKSLQSSGGTAVYTSNLKVSGKATITAKVDIWNKVKEGNEGNNKKTEKLDCKTAGVITGIVPGVVPGVVPGTLQPAGDLAVSITGCPQTVVPGQELGNSFTVRGKSSFSGPVEAVSVDLVLKKNPLYPSPAPYAVYSPNYSDGVLLKGGREHIDFAGPGWKQVTLNGTNTIPADTPPGVYYLAAVIDAGNKVAESNEKNNAAFCKIRVKGSSDLVLAEDCVSFNPKTVEVKRINGRWKIVDGSHWMFDFGNKKAEAEKAWQIIRYYGMNRSCFVGRPDPSFTYMLVSGSAPSGSFPGEDCVSFNPGTVEVKKINGRWKIVDGSHWMFDFGSNKAEAVQAFNIIKKYGFRYSCFVGRPDPSFTYLRK